MGLEPGLPVIVEGAGGGAGMGSTPRISSLLIKPVSALCNLDCSY